MSDAAPAVSIEHLTVSYQTKPVLIDVSLDVPRGTVVGILGPNGAGKSTVIKSVMGFVDRDYGTVRLFGEEVEHARGRGAYVPQRGQIDWTSWGATGMSAGTNRCAAPTTRSHAGR